MIRILISACLLGEKVRYNGADSACASPVMQGWLDEGRVVRFCPEVAGGLGVPRPAAEIRGTAGESVLDGSGRIVTRSGDDVTEAFLRGAGRALDAAREQNVRLAVLKEGSPSCGSNRIADGSFSGQRIPGRGVTAALFEREGIRVFSEEQLAQADAYLRSLEDGRHAIA